MKVYLTAFGGKLTGIMEIPENMPYVDLVLDLSSPKITETEFPLNSVWHRGTFERTGRHHFLKDLGFQGGMHEMVEEYKLINIH